MKLGSKVYQLAPFLDEHGVLRAGGRLHHSELAYGAKHPVLFSKHHLTELLLEKTHVERMHQGVEGVLSYICQKFWIIGGRRGLRNITQRCVICHRYKAKATSEVCPPLPDRHWRIMLEKVADFARKAVKLAEPYKPYGGQFQECCSISLSTYQTCRKSTEFCQLFYRHYPHMPTARRPS